MTKNTEESGQEVVEKESPAPTFTSPSDDSQTNSQPTDVSQIAKEVAELLAPNIAKQVQSVKDKRFSQLEQKKETVGSTTSMETLEALGVEITPEIKDKLLMQRIAALEKKGVSPEQLSVAPVVERAAGWSEVIDEVGLDDRMPEVVDLINGTYDNLDKFKIAAFELNAKLSNATPLPPEQQAILDSGKPATATAYTDEEVREKEAELALLQKNPTKYAKRIDRLYEELEPYWPDPV